MEKKKIIIFGDDPTGCTGFGKICDHLVDAVLAAGHIPIVVGLKANQNKNYEKAKIYNVLEFSDYQGWKTIGDVLINEKAGMVISIGDPWDIRGIAEIRQKIDFIWIGYVPVDSTPYPRYVLLVQQPQQYLDTAFLLNSMDYIVTFSEFGKNAVNDMLTNAFSESEPALKQRDIQNIYLGVDTRLYCPKDKPKARKVFNGAISSDTLLFSCIKVNSMRAGFDTLLKAWSIYIKLAEQGFPDLARRSRLYLHTSIQGSGYPIPVLMQRYHLENSLMLNPDITPGQGLPEDIMTNIVSAADICVSAVRGEGFGFNIIEAMGCGIPCIVPDYGCPAEYGGAAVKRVPIAATYNPEFATTDFAIIDAEQMAVTMLELALDHDKREEMGREGHKIACNMSWENFTSLWMDFIQSTLA